MLPKSDFPILQRKHNGQPIIFLDGPAGTQVPEYVINAMSEYYRSSNANSHGAFLTTKETDAMMADARRMMASFLGAEGPECISFGQNMTTLAYSLSRALARKLQPGDEVLITQLDHEANRGPWLALREHGIVVREVDMLSTGKLNQKDLEQKVNARTRLICMGYASNITGTVNDVAFARKKAYEVGAWLLLDAVHYAAHFPIDVQAIGCDFLLCSVYKFYGPHVGILYSRPGLLDQLPTDRLRTTDQHAPYKIETGTLNHAALAGVKATVEYISSKGQGTELRDQLVSTMSKIANHERALGEQLYYGIESIDSVQIIGPTFDEIERAPTISFYTAKMTAMEVCRQLTDHNIFAWDGHFYAIRATEVLGLYEKGGVTRMGISGYTDEGDVEKTIAVLREMLR
ncbi:MAG: cysteine desulfurase-like protein [Bacteroidia bacterium]|nr:cysteine desulfurase-like protein [Bacteroidia bacterium]